jgi:hypothetical protein
MSPAVLHRVGLAALIARLYADYWYWPLICTVVGIGSLIAGLLAWLKRSDHRARRGRTLS